MTLTPLNALCRSALAAALLLGAAALAAADTQDPASGIEPTEIDWDALIDQSWQPQALLDKFVADQNPTQEQIYDEVERLSAAAPIAAELDQQVIKMPGYVLPVEFDGTRVKEFLLVPFVGACIHVPPPPPNQVVYAKTLNQDSVEIEGMYAPVWVTGKMHVETVVSDYAEAAYTLEVYGVEPYEY